MDEAQRRLWNEDLMAELVKDCISGGLIVPDPIGSKYPLFRARQLLPEYVDSRLFEERFAAA